uniref:Retrovirus-related Pol polyprotein from transposon TNT 1-94 n=1 Tax=Tanacetum cinerariifolium TaxID=118510 RepID=A0A6L2JZV6_TANCI|nr:retrovirus-related Pol polyprotein from transposon TNT 1-94 [Tanacetum cinerariifolium]
MAAVNDVPQLVDKKGGSHAAIAPKLEPGKFNKWKKRMLCYLARMEPYYLKCIKDGPFQPKTAEDDVMKSVISCVSVKETWTDLVHSFEGPSDTKENMIMDLKLEYQTFRAKSTESLSQTYTHYKTLLNELANDGVNLSKHEINVGFINSLNEKWLTFSQGLRNANHTQTLDLADIYKDYKTKYKKIKAKLALREASSSNPQNPKTFQLKNKGLVAKIFDWDEEEVSEDEEVTQVKILIDEEVTPKQMTQESSKIQKTESSKLVDSSRILKSKAKPFPPCTHCGFNDHRPDDCRNYHECEMCRSYDHSTSEHNRVIHIKGGVLAESSQPNESSIGVKCNTCESTIHSTSDHNEFDHFKREEPGPKVVFDDNSSCITEGYGSINYGAPRRNDVYVLDMSSLTLNGACFFAKASESVNWLWHKRLSHLNFKNINKLAKQNKVIGLPSLVYSKDKPCKACEKGKHHRASFKTKQNFSIRESLHLLHMDLFGPVSPMSINHEKYALFIIDEYSRYTWVYFLRKKSQAPEMIMSFVMMVENQNDVKVKQTRTDNRTEFRNHKLESFCDEKGISQNFSHPYTPEQNGVAKRKNKTLIEAARTMLNRSVLSKHFWTEAAKIACYTQNKSIIVKRHDKTPHEIFRERILDISYFYVFGCPVFIHNHKDYLGKFDAKADDRYFLGYSSVSKAFKRLSIVHYAGYEAGESSVAAAARPIEGRRTDYGFVNSGHLATALGEIRVLQAKEQARVGAPEGAGSST